MNYLALCLCCVLVALEFLTSALRIFLYNYTNAWLALGLVTVKPVADLTSAALSTETQIIFHRLVGVLTAKDVTEE